MGATKTTKNQVGFSGLKQIIYCLLFLGLLASSQSAFSLSCRPLNFEYYFLCNQNTCQLRFGIGEKRTTNCGSFPIVENMEPELRGYLEQEISKSGKHKKDGIFKLVVQFARLPTSIVQKDDFIEALKNNYFVDLIDPQTGLMISGNYLDFIIRLNTPEVSLFRVADADVHLLNDLLRTFLVAEQKAEENYRFDRFMAWTSPIFIVSILLFTFFRTNYKWNKEDRLDRVTLGIWLVMIGYGFYDLSGNWIPSIFTLILFSFILIMFCLAVVKAFYHRLKCALSDETVDSI